MAEMLLDNGTHPEFCQQDVPEPKTYADGSLWLQPLLLAVINRYLAMIKLLLDKGANPNVWCSYQPDPSPSGFLPACALLGFKYKDGRWRRFQKEDDTDILIMLW